MLDRNEHVKGCSRSDLSDSDCMKNSQEGAVVRRELWSGGSCGQAGVAVRRERQEQRKNKKSKKSKKIPDAFFTNVLLIFRPYNEGVNKKHQNIRRR